MRVKGTVHQTLKFSHWIPMEVRIPSFYLYFSIYTYDKIMKFLKLSIAMYNYDPVP